MTDYQSVYAKSLDGLRYLAQRDLLGWWKRTSRVTFKQQKALLRDPFGAIIQVYGEQAAYVAADYLFMKRSLDESLRELEYPEVSDPVGFEQASKSYDWAMRSTGEVDEIQRELALRKLQAVTNRLVVAPARRTVGLGVLRAGTAYARVPEPGACPFCLMLASRGGVYTKQGVFGTLGKYHDNCRCLAIESKDDSDLPRINQDLMELSETLYREFDGDVTVNDWRQVITARKQQAGGETQWPRLQYCRIPRYKGDGYSTVFRGEKLPPLNKMPGHVLHGWRDDDKGKPHTEDLRQGHRWDSERQDATKFPKTWTDQKIVNVVRDTLEAPDAYLSSCTRRTVWKKVDGVLVMAQYDVLSNDKVKFNAAYPDRSIRRRARGVTY